MWLFKRRNVIKGIFLKRLLKNRFKRDYSDESQILEDLGIEVKIVKSDNFNIKVTTPEDIIIAEAFMKNTKKDEPKRRKTRFGLVMIFIEWLRAGPLLSPGKK